MSDFSTTVESDFSQDVSFYEEPQPEVVVAKVSPDKEKKYIVFESCLLSLFSTCPVCDQLTDVKIHTVGTFLSVSQSCKHCEYQHNWESQPFIKNVPAGNLLLSASILFTGSRPTKTLRVFDFLTCASITPRTFYEHQKRYLQPTILNVWSRQQKNVIEVLQALDKPLSLGGDGRSDSPGHSAKYGAYTLMELEHNFILDVELVQSNEVGSSYHMEKEGLVRGLHFMEANNLSIELLVTDRHKQINSWLKTNVPDIKHKYDVWHVAKSFKKKVKGGVTLRPRNCTTGC